MINSNSKNVPFQPAGILNIIHLLNSNFVKGRQEDAEEFLGCLLNKLSEEMLEVFTIFFS